MNTLLNGVLVLSLALAPMTGWSQVPSAPPEEDLVSALLFPESGVPPAEAFATYLEQVPDGSPTERLNQALINLDLAHPVYRREIVSSLAKTLEAVQTEIGQDWQALTGEERVRAVSESIPDLSFLAEVPVPVGTAYSSGKKCIWKKVVWGAIIVAVIGFFDKTFGIDEDVAKVLYNGGLITAVVAGYLQGRKCK